MEQEWYIITWFAATRSVHFCACLLVLGVCVFDRFVVAVVAQQEQVGIGRRWRSIARILLLLALPAVLLSGASWLLLVAMQMSALTLCETVHSDLLRLVWDQTQFGSLWKLRTILWSATAIAGVALVLQRRESILRNASAWLALALSGLLAASLAWSGHGQTGAPVAWHLLIDVLHIVVIGFWPIGLLPLALLLFAMRRAQAPEKWNVLSALIHRFSTTSLASVALLAASGLGNSWFLVGSVPNLIGTTYGRILLGKVGLFCVMVAVGAVNLLYLRPCLSAGGADANKESAAARLRFNVLVEVAFGSAVLIIVGILGLLPPATEPMRHLRHHHSDNEAAAVGARIATIGSDEPPPVFVLQSRPSRREVARRMAPGIRVATAW